MHRVQYKNLPSPRSCNIDKSAYYLSTPCLNVMLLHSAPLCTCNILAFQAAILFKSHGNFFSSSKFNINYYLSYYSLIFQSPWTRRPPVNNLTRNIPGKYLCCQKMSMTQKARNSLCTKQHAYLKRYQLINLSSK